MASNAQLPPLDPIPDSVAELIKLYKEHADVLKFPDVDAEILAEALQSLDAKRARVEEARLAFEEAREQVTVAHQNAMQKARQAHAYATVYAMGDEEVDEKLARIKLAAPQKTTRKRKAAPKPTPAEVETAESPSEESSTDEAKPSKAKSKAKASEEDAVSAEDAAVEEASSEAAEQAASTLEEPLGDLPSAP